MSWRTMALSGALGMVAFTLAHQAGAQTKAKGFELGARLGYGIPLGDGAEDDDMSEIITGQIPIWLDLGYRLSPGVTLGGYFQYGFGFAGDAFEGACDVDGISCRVTDIRLGFQAHYHFNPTAKVDPWLGAGIGYEWYTLSVSNDTEDASLSARGFEFLNLQGGLDIGVGQGVALGPFLSFSIDQFSETSVSDGDMTTSQDIDDKALHFWLVLGARVVVMP